MVTSLVVPETGAPTCSPQYRDISDSRHVEEEPATRRRMIV